VPKNTKQWWIVNDRGSVDLCPTDPGFPVDLYVTTDMRTMIAVWFGKLAWDAGVRSGQIEVVGPRELADCLRSWLLLSPVRMKGAAGSEGSDVAPLSAYPIAEIRPAAVLRP
jgi:hypothetical protein